ncbi:hypothetical protein KIPB_004766 [Kipferlia bialata]|uniref:Serine/threonine-protein phosphatase n=1 Tax=Kipferlia bialata TaxID=797122 RepID=A0A9K3GGS8_9EUKA|nr:hypothetical protein KIPB_004766 [Kipferlia bialata]|eukprot:g4766.t1
MLDKWLARLSECQRLKESEVRLLCQKAAEVLAGEGNVQHMAAPITVVGDIHGQFYDLKELFRVGGDLPEANYLFLGDFVDRGFYSVETLCWLLALKVRFPQRVTLLRGNHESQQISQVYGFYDECLRKYGSVNVWRHCTEVFNSMPLAGVVNNQTFCVHGGLSPAANTMEDIQNIDRNCEPPHDGLMNDLLWSDPKDRLEGFMTSPRGAGFEFGQDVVEQFLHANDFSLIARAHQIMPKGFQFLFDSKLVTVWSAPNYCYRCKNAAAILQLDEYGTRNFTVFEAAPQHTRGPQARRAVPEYFL